MVYTYRVSIKADMRAKRFTKTLFVLVFSNTQASKSICVRIYVFFIGSLHKNIGFYKFI